MRLVSASPGFWLRGGWSLGTSTLGCPVLPQRGPTWVHTSHIGPYRHCVIGPGIMWSLQPGKNVRSKTKCKNSKTLNFPRVWNDTEQRGSLQSIYSEDHFIKEPRTAIQMDINFAGATSVVLSDFLLSSKAICNTWYFDKQVSSGSPVGQMPLMGQSNGLSLPASSPLPFPKSLEQVCFLPKELPTQV